MGQVNERVLEISYDEQTHHAIVSTSVVNSDSVWYQRIHRVIADTSDSVEYDYEGRISTPWWVFINHKTEIGRIARQNCVTVSITGLAKELIRRSKEKEKELGESRILLSLTEADLLAKLDEKGWNTQYRKLKEYQIRNVLKLIGFTSAATFSVPGAGKTTEALAYFTIYAKVDHKLIVVAPKNAFISWDDELKFCISDQTAHFIRLIGGAQRIRTLLLSDSRFFIITYQQYTLVTNEIGQFLSENKCFMFLDESHKIKSGKGKTTADSVLALAHLPYYKLIMTGTPMPQSSEDLIAQFEFLYPEVRITADRIIEQIRPVFVRTTKAELNLPRIKREIVNIPLGTAQKKLYDLMCSEFVREAEQTLSRSQTSAYRSLGKSVIRLIEVVSNPALLLKDLGFVGDEFLGEVLSEGSAPKLVIACERARRLAAKGKKSIIWTTFRENVETIAERLSDLNAVFIHGGVDTGDDEDIGTREGKIKRFKNDENCFVLVANPAAASESISLHMVCHNAIYLDRTYNAAHYLQSEDRIHRLGLDKDTVTKVDILICPGSIDENIDTRLKQKVKKMASALNDDSLSIETVSYDIGDTPEEDIDALDREDIESLLGWLKKRE